MNPLAASSSCEHSRQFIILQGSCLALFNRLSPIIAKHEGDWVTITSQLSLPASFSYCISPNKAKQLLGREFKHAIFDATQGFHLDAFATLAGTLVKGSLFILLLPQSLDNYYDQDSLRWNESENPIATPHFISHLLDLMAKHHIATYHLTKHNPLADNIDKRLFQLSLQTDLVTGMDLMDQQNRLAELLRSNKAILAVIAKRGRGKSALAGLFTHYHHCMVTAPNKASLHSFFQFAKQPVVFYAPDELVAAYCTTLPDTSKLTLLPKYLIIDEAAMIPLPLLEKLLTLPCKILLTTTIDGYEGTGQGFLLKLLCGKEVDYFELTTPIRWHDGDLLEQFSEQLLCDAALVNPAEDELNHQPIGTDNLYYQQLDRHNISALTSVYQLLKSAHYRTTPTDLRRLFDADNVTVWQAQLDSLTIGALVAINEGGLSGSLIDAIWQGVRRPKGNLVAQSLVAHAGAPLGAKLRSVRINRIAISLSFRRQKVASKLILQLFNWAKAQSIDFLSVSFSYSTENLAFWANCGFSIAHIASHQSASSGTYSVMAIRAISPQGQQLRDKLTSQLQRNWPWLREIIDLKLDLKTNDSAQQIDDEQTLSFQDVQELHGFANFHRPFEASYPALCRLYLAIKSSQQNTVITPLFNALINQKQPIASVIKTHHLTGRQQLIKKLKIEINRILKTI